MCWMLWIPFLLSLVSQCDMHNAHLGGMKLPGSVTVLRERVPLREARWYANLDHEIVTVRLRGGSPVLLSDFQQKATILLRSVGGKLSSIAFSKRWAEIFPGDSLERYGIIWKEALWHEWSDVCLFCLRAIACCDYFQCYPNSSHITGT